MASHYHHYNHNYQHQINHSTCNCSCYTCCSSSCSSPPPQQQQQHPQSPITDTLMQALVASHLLQSSQPYPFSPQLLKPHHQQHQNHKPHQQQPQQQQQQQQQQQTQSLLTSLHRRIDSLESSFDKYISPSPSPRVSLRDLAARTIQTHFRVFLVRRSQTLRYLKHLAFIKSSLSKLKCCVSSNTHFDSRVISQKTMDLLLKLDSIQGRDSMIREGKKSISRELVQILECIDGVSIRKVVKNARFAEENKQARVFSDTHLKKLSDRVQKIEGFSRAYENDEEAHVELEGFHHISDEDEMLSPKYNYALKNGVSQARKGILVKIQDPYSKVKKRVSFVENGYQSFSSGVDDQMELLENLCSEEGEDISGFSRVYEDKEEEAHMEYEGPSLISYGGRDPTMNVKSKVISGFARKLDGHSGELLFSAPTPVQMEPRRDD
ncbi:hypothetical protein GIB67_007231 [Kingdonia uniflora]|uniref:BAG domain-containing protein n=1 Tax=Kingdonia uniflora TaxID=39325 RepID=A0A7J7NXB5_9MAGN|nr:hypothetical protein GIB67_007231 [Kingdonia uniflora]